jgi:hypothetical protein
MHRSACIHNYSTHTHVRARTPALPASKIKEYLHAYRPAYDAATLGARAQAHLRRSRSALPVAGTRCAAPTPSLSARSPVCPPARPPAHPPPACMTRQVSLSHRSRCAGWRANNEKPLGPDGRNTRTYIFNCGHALPGCYNAIHLPA